MRRSRAFERRYRRALQALRAECPPLLPVRVVRDARPGPVRLCGWTRLCADGHAFRIVLRERVVERGSRGVRRLFDSELIEVLMHEWAHAMAWTAGHSDLQDHPAAWGLAYAECYRTVIED